MSVIYGRDWPEVDDPGPYDNPALMSGATIRTMVDVAPEQVTWLWPGRLPAGKVVVIDGDPSVGKSTLTTDLAARVSTGAAWPDHSTNQVGPAGVLILSAEDGLADTIVPRLTVAGADLTNVHTILDVILADEDGIPRAVPPSLPRDLVTIEAVVRAHDVRLLVVDVLMAYLSGRVDSHRDQDVRGVLHQLASMAERTSCTVILIRHLNKTSGANPLYRGGGSIGIVGAARAAFLVARDPDDEGRRILAVTKSNLAVEPPALAYRLVSDATYGCARVDWEPNPVDSMTAANLLRGPVDDEERTERDEAVEWLLAYLEPQGGTAPFKDILRHARADGIAERTLRRARVRAQIVSERAGFPAQSFWTLPSVRPQSGQSGQDSSAGLTGRTVAGLAEEPSTPTDESGTDPQLDLDGRVAR